MIIFFKIQLLIVSSLTIMHSIFPNLEISEGLHKNNFISTIPTCRKDCYKWVLKCQVKGHPVRKPMFAVSRSLLSLSNTKLQGHEGNGQSLKCHGARQFIWNKSGKIWHILYQEANIKLFTKISLYLLQLMRYILNIFSKISVLLQSP